jgi:hypothetical protein
MWPFKQFLIEIKSVKPTPTPEEYLKSDHYAHFSELPTLTGGINFARNLIESVRSGMEFQPKGDGRMAVYVHHDGNGNYSVSGKNFNKKATNIKELEEHYGTVGRDKKPNPSLEALKKIFEHREAVYNSANEVRGRRGAVQAELLFGPDSKPTEHPDGKISFKGNIVENQLQGSEAIQARRAEAGLAIHSFFHADDPDKRQIATVDTKNLHENTSNKIFNMHLGTVSVPHSEHIDEIHKILSTPEFESTSQILNPIHSHWIKYLNHANGIGDELSAHGFKTFLQRRARMPAGKAENIPAALKHIDDNVEHVETHISHHVKLQNSIANFVDQLQQQYNQNNPNRRHVVIEHKTGIPHEVLEGFTPASSNELYNVIKFNSSQFVQANRQNPTFRQPTHAVITIGRFTTPGSHYKNLVKHVNDYQPEEGKEPTSRVVFASSKYEPQAGSKSAGKNRYPLPWHLKKEMLKHMVGPHTDLREMGGGRGLFDVVREIASNHDHVHLVLGQEDSNNFQSLKERLRNEPDHEFLNRVHVITRPGEEGVHSTALRNAAYEGDWETYKKAAHPNVPESLVKQIFDITKQSLQPRESKPRKKKND